MPLLALMLLGTTADPSISSEGTVVPNDLGPSLIVAGLMLLIAFMVIAGPRIRRADRRRLAEAKQKQVLAGKRSESR